MMHDMGGAADVLMIVMMFAMAGFSLAFAARVNPAWRQRIRHAIGRPADRPAATSEEGTR